MTAARERRLLRRAASGDRQALQSLYEEYSEKLFAIAYRLTESSADARDVLHDVFGGLPEMIRGFDHKRPLGPWLRSVTAHAALKYVRSERRRQEIAIAAAPDAAAVIASPELPVLDSIAVERALSSLTEELRTVVVLKEMEGYSHQEDRRPSPDRAVDLGGAVVQGAEAASRQAFRSVGSCKMESGTHDTHIDDRTLNRFADGVLPPRSAAVVQRHLRSCAVCRREVQHIRALSAALRAVPTPKPPDGLFEELFPEEAGSAAVIPLAVPQRQPVAFSRRLVLSAGACLVALIATVLVLTLGPERAVAGSSTLRFDREEPGAFLLRYETISPLAAEPGLRARLRYWVPDPLRFGQTEPGYSTVELSPEESGFFSGAVALPPGVVYAVAVVEDLDGNYIDNDFGRFWEYLETDAEGRPTLQARRYQLLATSELNVARAAAVAEEAASQFPEHPEFWVRQLLFAQGAVPPESRDAFLREHAARFTELDRAAREGNPGPVELDALHRYATFLSRPDRASYWSSQLVSRYPRHGAAALVHLQSITSSSVPAQRQLEDLEATWARTAAPTIAQVGLRLSIELADPALTRKWLGRHATSLVVRNLSYDTEIARDMMAVPLLGSLAETWILDRLAESPNELGPERPLAQSRRNFRAEASQHHARLNLYLARNRLVRGQLAAAVDAAERAVERTWSPEVFLEAAEIHRVAGSAVRALELLALSVVDPITPLQPRRRADGLWDGAEPSEEQLVAARTTMHERVTSGLLDEHVNLNAQLRSADGEATTLREAVGGQLVLVVQALRPDLVPEDARALLDLNFERSSAAGVQALMLAQHLPPAALQQPGFDSRFLHDVRDEAWDSLGAWREVQYFVLDPSGRLRHRGEDVEAALRVSFVLSTRIVASAGAAPN